VHGRVVVASIGGIDLQQQRQQQPPQQS
jgi:hypothetical protein